MYPLPEQLSHGGLIRVQHLGSLRGEQTRFFRPHPQPLSHAVRERGVGAHGGAFPLSREAGEGDTGGEGNTARLPNNARTGQMAPLRAFLA